MVLGEGFALLINAGFWCVDIMQVLHHMCPDLCTRLSLL